MSLPRCPECHAECIVKQIITSIPHGNTWESHYTECPQCGLVWSETHQPREEKDV